MTTPIGEIADLPLDRPADRFVLLSSLVFTAVAACLPQPAHTPGAEKLQEGPAPNRSLAARILNSPLVPDIAGQWRIPEPLAASIVHHAIESGERHDIDPLLVLAVISAESGFRPSAVSPRNAEGLMQVQRRWHPEKLAAVGVGQSDPMTVPQNIEVGTRVLREYLDQEDGRLTHALQRYNGAREEPELRYASKVLAYYQPLRERYAALGDEATPDRRPRRPGI